MSALKIKHDEVAKPALADLAAGFILTPEFSTVGGIANTETETKRSKKEQIVTRVVRYDSPDLQGRAARIVDEAFRLTREFCSPAFAGQYFCPEDSFENLDRELQPLRDAAFTLNKAALRLGSQRETTIEVYPLVVDRNNLRVRARIAKTVWERLKLLRDVYTSPVQQAYGSVMRGSKNLHVMLTGQQRQVVQAALDASVSQRPIMIAHQGGRRGVKQLRDQHNGQVPALDYGPIDRAILMFGNKP